MSLIRIDQIYSLSKRIGKDDPPVIVDVPYYFKAVLAQILVPAGSPSLKNSLVTSDENEFVDVTDKVFQEHVCQITQNRIQIDWTFFNGLFTDTFVLNLCYIR